MKTAYKRISIHPTYQTSTDAQSQSPAVAERLWCCAVAGTYCARPSRATAPCPPCRRIFRCHAGIGRAAPDPGSPLVFDRWPQIRRSVGRSWAFDGRTNVRAPTNIYATDRICTAELESTCDSSLHCRCTDRNRDCESFAFAWMPTFGMCCEALVVFFFLNLI